MSSMFQRLHIAAFPIFLLLLVQILLQARVGWPIVDGVLIDTDSYMRMVRIRELIETGAWYDRVIERSNAPYGEVLHWTRALDLFVLAGAFVSSVFVEFDDALFLSAIFVGPILHLATLLALLWASEFVIPPSGRVYVGILFVAQMFLAQIFALGRVDHHGIFILIVVVLLGLGLKLLTAQANVRTAFMAGIVAGIGMWVGVEGLIGVTMILSLLGIAWVLDRGEYAKHGFVFSATLSSMATLVIASEHQPAMWFVAQYDILSIVHLSIFTLISIFWAAVLGKTLSRTKRHRFILILVSVGVGVALVGLVYPSFFSGPMADVDPDVMTLWFNNNQEVLPIIDGARPLYSLQRVFLFLGAALLAIPFIIYILSKSDGLERRNWLYISGCFSIALALAFLQVRWTAYAQLFAILPIVGLLLSLLEYVTKRFSGLPRAIIRAAAVLLFAIGPPFVSLALQPTSTVSSTARISDSCNLRGLTNFLNDGYSAGPARTILTHNNYGPEILYRTRHRVISTPYHRNASGILDAMNLFKSTDETKALSLLKNRKVDLIIVCPGGSETSYYRSANMDITIYDRLLELPPTWLRRIEFPDNAANTILIFEPNVE
jgi:hypothetical protein